jgi:WD40 repeat protein
VRACDQFNELTSISVGADDRQYAVSGYSNNVGLFDLETGRCVETLHNLHSMHINVLKFANNDPNILVTSSFDRYVKKWDLRESRPGGYRRPVFERCSDDGNIMVCFSPDDNHLLVSAVDNEVRQYTACDGRLENLFDIPRSNKLGNYTRSYYMNGSEYVITGSCKEDVVRVYNAQSGQYVREIEFDSERTGLMYVQSLRANPLRDSNLSVLLACEDLVMHGATTQFELLANVDLSSRPGSATGCPGVFA